MNQNNEMFPRIPPNSVENEQAVLGCLLLDDETWDEIADLLHIQDFYRSEHQIIFAHIKQLKEQEKRVDAITVFEALQRGGKQDSVGGLAYLTELSLGIGMAINIREYANIVREKSLARTLLRATAEISETIYQHQYQNIDQALDEAESKILQVAQQGEKANQDFIRINSIAQMVFDDIMEKYEQGYDGGLLGMSTGLNDLDHSTSGFQPGQLIVLGARPGMGKTTLALNIAQHIGIDQTTPVAIFSMEMSHSELMMRFFASLARVPLNNVRTAQMDSEQWYHLGQAVEKCSTAPVYVCDDGSLNVLELAAKARRLQKKYGQLGLIVVDYLQLLSGTGSNKGDSSRVHELTEASRMLKLLAKELKCPILALAQVKRDVETRGADKAPMMSDIRDCGAIEQDADIVMFLHSKENKDQNISAGANDVVELHIVKQRSGPTGIVKLTFRKNMTRFEGYTGQEVYY